jgi:hypothetical protein
VLVEGCIAIEVVYGKLTDSIWEGMNQGVSSKPFFTALLLACHHHTAMSTSYLLFVASV